MAQCTHWGVSGTINCHSVCPEIVYLDSDGHQYCILHAPKYYVQPKGIYFGDSQSFTRTSQQEKKDAFKNALDTFIQMQSKSDTIRFDKIYWPKDFSNSLDSQHYPDKIFQFIGCYNIPTISNSKIKSVRFLGNKISSPYIHTLETNEILLNGEGISRVTIRDSKIDSIVFSSAHCSDTVSINSIQPLSENGVWGTGVKLKNSIFDKIVKIEGLEFSLKNRDVIIEDSIFNQNLYYSDNTISGWIDLNKNTFGSSKTYFENIDLTKARLTRHNLEYLKFSNCIFPKSYPELEKKSLTRAEEVYRDLKTLAEEKKDYELVSRWHFLEKEMLFLNSNRNGKTVTSIFLRLYKYLCGYGEMPSRAFYVLMLYFLAVLFCLMTIALIHTGFHSNFDWKIIRTFPFSYADFIPLFVTPTRNSLADMLGNTDGLLIAYNMIAALGRIFCIIQVGLFSMAIRNHLKR